MTLFDGLQCAPDNLWLKALNIYLDKAHIKVMLPDVIIKGNNPHILLEVNPLMAVNGHGGSSIRYASGPAKSDGARLFTKAFLMSKDITCLNIISQHGAQLLVAQVTRFKLCSFELPNSALNSNRVSPTEPPASIMSLPLR